MPNVDGQATQVVTGAPMMPRVNLMPPEIAEAAKFRRFQLAMGGAVVGAVGIVVALYLSAHSGVASAQNQLVEVQQQHAALQTQRAQLQSVQDVYTQVAAKQTMLSTAMSDEIRWSTYLNDLSLRIPDHVWLTNVDDSGRDCLDSHRQRGIHRIRVQPRRRRHLARGGRQGEGLREPLLHQFNGNDHRAAHLRQLHVVGRPE
jgi:Tfp pilus assembly protein PilN